MTVITAADEPTVDRLMNLLARAGMRRTLASRAVAEVLAAADCLTAAEVQARLHARGIRADLTTVHRVLRRLTEVGATIQIPRGSAFGYRIALPDGHWLVCPACGRTAPLTGTTASALLADVRAAGFGAGPITVATRCPDCH